jgi:hypothetical protein
MFLLRYTTVDRGQQKKRLTLAKFAGLTCHELATLGGPHVVSKKATYGPHVANERAAECE